MKNELQIAVFADLESPKVASYTTDQISKSLERIANDGFEYFSPTNFGFYFLGNMARMNPDSEYGSRMDLTQKMIASALYSGEELAKYFGKVSLENGEKANAEEMKYRSRMSRLTRSIKLMMVKLGGERNNLDSYLSEEQKSIARKRVLSDVYHKLAVTVDEIVREFAKQNTQTIIKLVELNYLFSAVRNGTEQDITFTNPRLRHYSVEIQQQIHRTWYNGTIEDSVNPLSEQQLLPLRTQSQSNR